MLTNAKKKHLIKKSQMHDMDTGSSLVQVMLLSQRISELSDHLKENKKDISSRRGLVKLVDTRRKHLSYLKSRDIKSYEEIIAKTGLKK